MNISVEISYYPMQEEYVQSILEFINCLNNYTELDIKNTGISTQVFGEYKSVMRALTVEIEKSFAIPNSVFVLKIINSDLQTHPNSYE